MDLAGSSHRSRRSSVDAGAAVFKLALCRRGSRRRCAPATARASRPALLSQAGAPSSKLAASWCSSCRSALRRRSSRRRWAPRLLVSLTKEEGLPHLVAGHRLLLFRQLSGPRHSAVPAPSHTRRQMTGLSPASPGRCALPWQFCFTIATYHGVALAVLSRRRPSEAARNSIKLPRIWPRNSLWARTQLV